jgi:phage terminase small subunit
MKSDMQRPIPEPPEHLTERSQALWRELVKRRCDSAERQLLLECALTDLDRADALRQRIEREGAMVTSARSKLPRAHPALKIEAEMRRRFLAAWRALDLTWAQRGY